MVDQLAILAPGLLGASVARAARARGVARRIVVWARRPETRMAVAKQDWCDSAVDTPGEAAASSSLVLLAAPVDRIVPLAQEIAPQVKEGAVVTDVGSVKGRICRLAHEVLRERAHFVGAHPMAGSEKTGWENASADLFQGRTCFVTPVVGTSEKAVAKTVEFWQDLGAEVVSFDPDRHDEIVAHISHLPQLVASALCSFLADRDPTWRNFAGQGLRDTTRIAASDSKVWRAILEDNRDEVLRALRMYQDELQGLQAALANRNFIEVTALLERGRAYRNHFRPQP